MENQIKLSPLAEFLTSPAGRTAKILIGLVLIAKGLKSERLQKSSFLLIGVIPLAAGILDLDPWMRLFAGSSKGSDIRFQLHMQSGYPQLGSESQTWFKS